MPVKKKKPVKRKSVKRRSTVREVPSLAKTDSSINIRKIENGLVVRISKHTRNKYTEKEYFAKSDQEVKEIVGKAL